MPGVGLMVRVVGLESSDPEFKSPFSVKLIPGGVDSACHPSEVGKMSASLLVSCIGVATRPGLCPNSQGDCLLLNSIHNLFRKIAKAAPTLCTEFVPDGWRV